MYDWINGLGKPKENVKTIIVNYLEANPKNSLKVYDEDGKIAEVALNSQGQLCFKKGVNLELVAEERELQLAEEIPKPAVVEEVTAVGTAQPIVDTAFYRRVALGISRMVEEVSAPMVPDLVEPPKKVEKNEMDDLVTQFFYDYRGRNLPVSKIHEGYFVAIVASIAEKYKEVAAQSKYPKKITTEGEVRDAAQIMVPLEKMLTERGYKMEKVDPGKKYAMARIRVWEDFDVMDEDEDVDSVQGG